MTEDNNISLQMNKRAATLASALSVICCVGMYASGEKDDGRFKGYLYNAEYNTYMRISLVSQDIVAQGHELYGELPGYLAKVNNTFYWLITSAEMVSEDEASLSIINDYGSEDLKATLRMKDDSTYVLTQGSGSTIKIPDSGKWKKLPKKMTFIKQKGKR